MIDYYTITRRGQRQGYMTLETAALAAHRHGRPRVVVVGRMLEDGKVVVRERDVTARALDYLSTCHLGDSMITITHNRAKFTVNPDSAQEVHDLLAKIDKSKGMKGAKLPKPKGDRRFNSTIRDYPVFSAGMTTGHYLRHYEALNHKRLGLASVEYVFADRAAAMLDPSAPEVVQEVAE
jgi:hypothetical protein